MKRLHIYLGVLCLMAVGLSCMKDNSSFGSKISTIQINLSNVTDTLNLDKNAVLALDPEITQDMEGKPLTYEWQVNHEIVSTEKKLEYNFSKLGTFDFRLKVSNEHGSTFKHFFVYVNSPYEEGVLILGENAASEGTISFLRKYSAEEIAAGKVPAFETNCFERNNPGHKIGKKPSDIVKRKGQLLISSQEEGKVSLVNTKTFELESIITASEFPDFKPVKMNIPDNTARSSFVLCENGSLYDLATAEHLVLKSSAAPVGVKFDLKTAFVGGINFTSNYFWDAANSRYWNLWYTKTNTKDTLAGQELVQFFAVPGKTYILTRDKNDHSKIRKSVFGEYIQVFFADPLDYQVKADFVNPASTLTSSSVTAVSDKYQKLVYANGNKIYGWFYNGVDIPATPYITVDIPGSVTCMNISPDGNQLYVAVNNPAAAGLKGSLLIYNIDNGALISKYEGIADKPVKVFYKTK